VTAHYYLPSLRRAVKLPILSIIEEAVAHLEKNFKGKNRVGLLSTTGTLRTGIFQEELQKGSRTVVMLPAGLQDRFVMRAVYGKRGIKAGYRNTRHNRLLRRAAEALVARGAEVVLAACTEIPLVLHQEDLAVPLVDTVDLLAARAVRFCLGSTQD
jgi:aspartate racemase